MVGEALNFLIKEAKNFGFIGGLRLGHDELEVTHLQFADDKLLFIPKNSEMVINYRRILQCFSLMSELTINYTKSSLVSWGVNEDWIHEMSMELGCTHQKLPINYLGIPLGENPRLLKFWESVITKIEKRISLWKSKLMSKARRLQLIKSVLTNLHVYYLGLFRIPDAVAKI